MNYRLILPALFLGASLLPASATVLFLDNFNVADSASFDAAPLTGRLSGTAGAETKLQSYAAQQSLAGGQLSMVGTGGVRIGDQTARYDWAGATTGSAVLAAGGMVVSFNWTPPDNTATNWVSLQIGTVNTDTVNLTDAGTDYGILFRNNGATERFDNGTNLGAAGTLTLAGGAQRLVSVTYTFGSFADGATVQAVSRINGTVLATDTFIWDGNAGQIRLEMGANSAGSFIDNFQVATVPEPATALLVPAALGLLTLRRRRVA